MLISQKHNFIFIHIYKNAGTSISRALIPYCSNPIQLFAHRLLKRVGISKLNPMPYHKHIDASSMIQDMGYDTFKSYFSFAVVRNPWDWNVSLYNYVLKSKDHHQHEYVKKLKNFDEYIRNKCKKPQTTFQKDFIYSKSGKKLVDYIARFENIDNEFEVICQQIGIKIKKLPHLNISNMTHYRDYYSDETRELIRQTYQADIELFDYEF